MQNNQVEKLRKWEVNVADTERYITDGSINLFCYDDLVETEELQEICDKLNKIENEQATPQNY